MPSNIRIEIVLTDISQCGGTERTVLSVANYLYSNGFDIIITSLSSKYGDLPYFQVNENIPICHLGIKSYTNKSLYSKIVGWNESLIKIRHHFNESQSNIILSTSRNTNFFSVLFKKKNQCIIGCEHFAFNVPMNSILRRTRDKIYKKLDTLVVLTNKDLNYYVQRGIKTIVIPNAIPIEDERINISNKDKIAISIGRHTEQKAFSKLIKIWKNVYPQIPDWKLLIIGEGPLLNYNKNLAKQIGVKNIEFKDFTKNIKDIYSNASLYLMTSIYEAFPMVLIEAKYFGCVSIAFNCDTGPAEIIKNGVDGFIVEMNNTKLFENKILELAFNPKQLVTMQRNAIKNSEEYLKRNILPNWIKLINNLQHGENIN